MVTAGIQTSTVYWPAKMADIDKIVMFQLQFWDAGENALKKFDHVMPVRIKFIIFSHVLMNTLIKKEAIMLIDYNHSDATP